MEQFLIYMGVFCVYLWTSYTAYSGYKLLKNNSPIIKKVILTMEIACIVGITIIGIEDKQVFWYLGFIPIGLTLVYLLYRKGLWWKGC